tara:strand:+ start:2471 stop:2626 length:156 start_codon:yes stop_codon:yes gene_type:complete
MNEYDKGFKEAEEWVVSMINEYCGLKVKTVADLIVYVNHLREKELEKKNAP